MLRFHLDALPLHPAYYHCSAALAGGGFFYDIVDPIAIWQVKTSDEDQWSDRGAGGCRLEPSVELTPIHGTV